MRALTLTVKAGLDDGAKAESVGTSLAVRLVGPMREGRQLQVDVNPELGMEIQPAIFFPFAKYVTLPSLPATPNKALIEALVRKVAKAFVVIEILEDEGITPPLPETVNKK